MRLRHETNVWGMLLGVVLLMAASQELRAQTPIELWPRGTIEQRDVPEAENYVGLLKQTIIQNVGQPTLIPYLAPEDNNTGIGVIVAPGGGFKFLAPREGHAVAEWLSQRGINAFVLKYRVESTPQGSTAFTWHLLWSLAKGLWAKSDEYGSLKRSPIEPDAINDGMRAVELVRRKAAEWRDRDDAIGILGFSAGASVAIGSALQGIDESKPDFIASIYGAASIDNLPDNLPPLYIMATMDDPLIPYTWAEETANRWQASGARAQLMYYPEGGHGFGMRQQNLASDQWPNDFSLWLQAIAKE